MFLYFYFTFFNGTNILCLATIIIVGRQKVTMRKN